jgi:hypothetical protein
MSETQQLTGTKQQTQQSARTLDTYGLLACIAISAFATAWITVASRSFNLRSVLFLLVLPWVLLRAGAIVTAALRFPSFFALDFLLGVTVISVVVMTWKFFVPLSVWFLLIVVHPGDSNSGQPSLMITRHSSPTAIEFTTWSVVSTYAVDFCRSVAVARRFY